MKTVVRLLLGSACLSLAIVPVAQAADHAYVVSYVEVLPSEKDRAAELLRRLALLSRKDPGSVRFEVLQRIGYPDQFALVEVWQDAKALEAHGAAAHTQLFREKLKPLLRAPYDERPHLTLAVGPVASEAAKKEGRVRGAVFAVTHVDVVPKAKDAGTDAVRELSLASRTSGGNLRFDALTQANRPNHMTLVEVWKDQKAVGTHSAAAHTRQFREKLGPLTGALFDERFYRALD